MRNGKSSRNGHNTKRGSRVSTPTKKGGTASRHKSKSMETTTADGAPRHNDPNWYFLDANIAEQASSISFASYLGVPTPVSMYLYSDGEETVDRYTADISVPTIMQINCNPCPGDTSDTKSGINIAALKLYSDLSAMNAKTTNYAPQDLTMLLLSLGEVISVMEHIRRAFGVAFTYSVRNRDLPLKLLEAMGFNDTFLTSIADNRLRFNSLITAINKIPFVSNIAYFYKCADMYQRVYLDSDSPMAQVMVMRPYSTWTLVEDEIDTGAYLSTTELPRYTATGKLAPTFENWITIAQNMIDALFQSATFNYIYSDIINYSSKTGASLLYLDYLLEGYTVVPEFNPNFSMQIHNSNLAGVPVYDGNPDGPIGIELTSSFTKFNDVVPDVNKNKVHYYPVFTRTGVLEGSFMDMPTPTPSTADKVEATRYVTNFDFYGTYRTDAGKLGFLFTPVAFPDHYITYIDVFGANFSGGINNLVIPTGLGDGALGALAVAARLYPFKSAPIFYSYETDITPDLPLTFSHIYGELNYFTYLPKTWFARVNDLTFQALFTLR